MDQLITLPRIKKYIFQVLQALKYAHSKNIYHRDIKPQNILYDPQTEQVFVADWGLADYCFPGRVQSLKLGSRCYRAPQLYLLNQNYDCSVDIWAVGCVFGALIFYKNTLFRGNSNETQIQEIAEVAIGTEQIKAYVHKFSLSPDKKLVQFLNNTTIQKKPWSSLIYKKYKETASEEALDLLSKMLTIDHTQRITAQQALNHKFFSKE